MIEIIFVAVFTFLSTFWFMRSMHMFQLNSYKTDIHCKWLGNNWVRLMFAFKRAKAKKPLVYTPRVIRMCVTMWLVYDLIMLALVVWTDFYYLLAVVSLFAPCFPILVNVINMPFERFNNKRYINEAKHILKSCENLIIIGITGSYGKTSTKYFLEKLLGVKYNVLMTPASFNTTLGVVKTIRESLKATHEIFICEMGLMWTGDIKELCEIVKPTHSILTSIGSQHLETMKSLDNIINEKFEIANCINNGFIFLNYDNDYIRNRQVDKNIVKYGITADDADYRASNITVSEKGTEFTVTVNGESARFSTPLLGAHNVQNITGAIAAAHKLGISLQELVRPVKRLEPVPHRLEIINKKDAVIIDDAFNSNPAGARAALDVLSMFEGVKFFVTPGMVELGERTFELNKELGGYAAEKCDYAVLIGEKQAAPIKDGLLEKGFPNENISIFKTLSAGLDFIYNFNLPVKKIVLLENDLPDNY